MLTAHEMSEIPFFRNLGGPHADELARIAQPTEYPPGAVLFRQKQDSPFIYFVLAGEVRLEVEVSGREFAEVHRVGPGELLGWSPVLGRRSMTATARAATPVRLAALGVEELLRLREGNPQFAAAFFREVAVVVSARLDDTRRRLSHHLSRRPVPGEGSD